MSEDREEQSTQRVIRFSAHSLFSPQASDLHFVASSPPPHPSLMFSCFQLKHQMQQQSFQRTTTSQRGFVRAVLARSRRWWSRLVPPPSPNPLACPNSLVRLMRDHTCNLHHQLPPLSQHRNDEVWPQMDVSPWLLSSMRSTVHHT